jgi:tetratricopeptide (TPR) repeat protein
VAQQPATQTRTEQTNMRTSMLILGLLSQVGAMTLTTDHPLVNPCDYRDSDHLFQLLNQLSQQRSEQTLHDQTHLIGPKLNVAFLSPFLLNPENNFTEMVSSDGSHSIVTTESNISTSKYQRDYSTFAYAINEYYARHHGYNYFIPQNLPSTSATLNLTSIPMSWHTIAQLRHSLKTWARDYDYLVYSTFDSIFINSNLFIEQLFQKKKGNKINIIFLTGGAMTGAKISSDLIFVKNNHWTVDFLDDLWTTRDRERFTWLQVYDELVQLNEDEYKEHILTISNQIFRNDYPAMSKYLPTHHLLSFPLELAEYKRNIYEEIFELICSHEKKNTNAEKGVSLQDVITRDMLKMSSVETYRGIWEERLSEFTSKAQTGDNSPLDTDRLSTVTVYLSNTISLFEPEVEYFSTATATDTSTPSTSTLSEAHLESMKILSQTFKQMFLNLKRYRLKLSPDKPLKVMEYVKLDSHYSQMLKGVLRLGQEYMAHLKQNPKEVKLLTIILRDLLEDLVTINPKDVETQEALVYLDVDIGRDHMEHGRYQQALADFLSALRVARRVGNYIGDQIVLSPANQAAEAMVMLERYEEAVVLYDTVVPLTQKHNGEQDLTSGYIYIQAAFAYHQFNRHKTANKLLEKAIEILEMNGVDVTDKKIYEHAKEMERNTRGRRDEDDEMANREYGF